MAQFLLAQKKLETGIDTGIDTGKDGWVVLAEHQEGREKGGAHCLDTSASLYISLAWSYAQACRSFSL